VVQIWFRHCSSASRTDHFTFLISRSFGFNCFTYSLSEATWPLCDIVGILVQLPGLRYSRCNYPPTPRRRLRRLRRLIGVGHGVQRIGDGVGVGRASDRRPRDGGVEGRRTCGQTAAVLTARSARAVSVDYQVCVPQQVRRPLRLDGAWPSAGAQQSTAARNPGQVIALLSR